MIDKLKTLPPSLLKYLLGILQDTVPNAPSVPKKEWDSFAALLSSQGILPLLYFKIAKLEKKQQPPAETLEQLRQAFFASDIRSIKIEKTLQTIIPALRQQGIEVIALKGAALAWSLYPNPATRTGCDIDILACKKDVVSIRKTLVEIGFSCKKQVFDTLADLEIEEIFTSNGSLKFLYPVEVHWLLHGFPGAIKQTNPDDYFKRAQTIKTETLNFLTLDPVDSLIHVIIHMSMIHNQDTRLLWIYDIGLLAEKITQTNAWSTLKERSTKLGVRPAVLHCLKLAEAWTHFKLPEEICPIDEWLTPSKKEIVAFNNTITRQGHLDRWLKVRWPRHVGVIKSAKIFFDLVLDQTGIRRRK